MISPEIVSETSRAAVRRIGPHLQRTPLIKDGTIFYKCENLQTTGSFKLRGALSKLTTLSDVERDAGVVTASTGNHGAAVAYAAGVTGSRATVFVPDIASSLKVEAIQRYGGVVEVFGSDGVESELEARRVAYETSRVYVSPYNDLDVIAGQGTIGLEILEDLPDVDAVVVSVGGGGLISGVASVLKSTRPDLKVIACSPVNSAVMAASLEAGRIVEIPSLDTISDGTHGGIENDSITFGLCQQLIDQFVLVSEEEIGSAMSSFMGRHDMRIEGSAGVALAAYKRLGDELGTQKAVVILCGENISDEKLATL